MNAFVCVDACVAAKWVLPESDSDLAFELYMQINADRDSIIVPPHMPIEVANTIRKKQRRGEITPADAENALDAFLIFPIRIALPEGLYKTSLELAQKYDRPTVYDTQYVALAQIAGCDFWTADQRLLNALDGRLPFVRDLREFRPD